MAADIKASRSKVGVWIRNSTDNYYCKLPQGFFAVCWFLTLLLLVEATNTWWVKTQIIYRHQNNLLIQLIWLWIAGRSLSKINLKKIDRQINLQLWSHSLRVHWNLSSTNHAQWMISSVSSTEVAPRQLHHLLFHLPQDLQKDFDAAWELNRSRVGSTQTPSSLLKAASWREGGSRTLFGSQTAPAPSHGRWTQWSTPPFVGSLYIVTTPRSSVSGPLASSLCHFQASPCKASYKECTTVIWAIYEKFVTDQMSLCDQPVTNLMKHDTGSLDSQVTRNFCSGSSGIVMKQMKHRLWWGLSQ